MIQIKKVLVATDFGAASDTALRYGRELARAFHATLDVLHVTQDLFLMASTGYEFASLPVGVQQDVERAAQHQADGLLTDEDRRDLEAKAVCIAGNTPAAAIITYAVDHKADLIVIGTHGRGGLAHLFMGSVAERVVRLAPCPVLTVHHPEHEFVQPDALVAVARQ
jgi:nucleotide-binding universal stress UspA family protein